MPVIFYYRFDPAEEIEHIRSPGDSSFLTKAEIFEYASQGAHALAAGHDGYRYWVVWLDDREEMAFSLFAALLKDDRIEHKTKRY